MEIISLIGLLLLALPIVAIVLAANTSSKQKVMSDEIKRLTEAVRVLQSDLSLPSSKLKTKANKSDTVSEKVKAPPKKVSVKKNKKADKALEANVANKQQSKAPKLSADKTSAPKRNAVDLEKLIGAKWSVILGGIAIAFGAIFLVKYSIESGLLGPGARITMGVILSAALFFGGEWMRQKDQKLKSPIFEKADIPGILTGVGAISAFATLYAAYALYGFIGPGAAFVGLTLVALATLFLSSIHGPKLAAIGVLGAYCVPALVSSQTPNAVALAIHVLVVTACVLAIARIRQWLWLAIAGMVGAVVWTIIEASISTPLSPYAGAFMLVITAALIVITFGWTSDVKQQIISGDNLKDDSHNWIVVIGGAAIAFAFIVQAESHLYFPDIITGVILSVIFMGAAMIVPEMVLASFIAFLIIAISALLHHLSLLDIPGMMQGGEKFQSTQDINTYLFELASLLLPAIALGAFGSYRSAIPAPRMSGYLATATTAIISFVILAAYMRISPFETKFIFGVVAVIAALGLVYLVEKFTQLMPHNMSAPAPAAFAVGAVTLLSFAIGVTLSKAWLPFGFSLTALGIAFIYKQRPIAVLPILSIVATGLAGVALYFNAPFARADIGTTPIFNALIILIGLPSIALLATGEVLRREIMTHKVENDKIAKMPDIATSFGLAAFGLFVSLEIRHWLHNGNITADKFNLADMASQTIAALCFAIGLQLVAKRTSSSIFSKATYVLGIISYALIVLGLVCIFNPYFSSQGVGDAFFFSMLLPAYLIPAILAGVVTYMARPVRSRKYTLSYAFLSGLMFFIFVSLSNRHWFQGSYLAQYRATSDLEFWMYSALWLALGISLLILGLRLKSLPIRIAAGLLMVLTIAKVFILDLSSLTGILRALSFLGLGGLLLVIGRFYQRLIITSDDEKQETQTASNK